MLKALSEFFDQTFGNDAAEDESAREHELKLATAVLLVEVARADFAEDAIEDEAIIALLERHLELSSREARHLVDEAKKRADHSASLQSFTRLLHEEVDLAEKHRIVEMLWRVALADQELDKHEDHLIRKVAGLLYISHSDLIRIRNEVTKSSG
ncbi:MAG: TerB family tellurite resistance protein [Gammaproteobacteria bacterium]|nr:TerB family tellurite resistance protein [Gammaproteobacteria bacterium]